MTKKILQAIPTLQAAALMGDNYKFHKKKKKDTGDFVTQGVKNIVGVNLISETADIIEDF